MRLTELMDNVKLSIIIVSYNTKEFLRQCIFSIFNTVESAIETEVIVIDNASTDGSAQMVRTEFPSARLIINKENLGFARAVNQGLKDNRGNYKLLLNSDTVLIDNAIKAMLEFLQKNPRVGAVRPKIISPDGKLQRQGAGVLKFLKNPEKPHKLKWVSGCCMLIRDEVIKDIGLLDENFFFYNEDVDYSRRMKKKGWELYYFPGACVIHHLGASSLDTDRLLLEQYRGKYYYYQKHYGRFILFLYKIFTAFKLMVKIGISLFECNSKVREEANIYSRILKMTFIFLFFCFVNLLTSIPLGHSEIKVGEKLIYNVKIGIFSAGIQVVEVSEKTYIDSISVYHIISRTKTNQFFSIFYKMDNTVEAFIDESGLTLRKLIKNLNEGSFREKSIAILKPETGTGQIIKNNFSKTIEVPLFVLDVVSMQYYLRSLDLSLNKKILLNVLTDNGVRVYEAKVEAKENVNTGIGKFETFRIVENVEKIKLWISTDSKRLPVKISIGTNFGDIIGILNKVE